MVTGVVLLVLKRVSVRAEPDGLAYSFSGTNARLAELGTSWGSMPLRGTMAGEPAALVWMSAADVRVPWALGEKDTKTLQEAYAAIEAGQLFVWAKSAPSGALNETPEKAIAEELGLVTVMVSLALVLTVAGKVRPVAGETSSAPL